MVMTVLARLGASPQARIPFRTWFGRPFSRRAQNRVLVVYEPTRIAFSQVYPFLMYGDAFAARHDAQFRLLPRTEVAERGIGRGHQGATHVLFQTWALHGSHEIDALRPHFDALPEAPRRIYLDPFANCDLRFARDLPDVDLYYRKSLLIRDEDMLRPLGGHSVLGEYYGRHYRDEQEHMHWQVPPDFLPRLRLAPNFLTAPDLAQGLLGAAPPPQDGSRDIDLHARVGGTAADGWYGAMRRDAEARVEALSGVSCAIGYGVSKAQFMAELCRSKICFSPMGYGEVCWRDIEAFVAGSVLLKPDMSHLRTAPDLYRDDETYVAIRWDFSDFEDKLRALLADAPRRERIARTAWQEARRYLQQDGPVSAYADIFSG